MRSQSKFLSWVFIVVNFAFIVIFYWFWQSFSGTKFTDALIILFLPHLLVPLVSIGLASLFIRLYTKLGRWLKFGRYYLGLYEYSKEYSTRELIGRSLYAAFFSLTLGLMGAQFYLSSGSVLAAVSSTEAPKTGMVLLFTLLLSPIAAVVQAPMWWSEDLGIMLIRKTDREPVAPDIASVGRFMNAVMRGFITVSTPVLYINILVSIWPDGIREIFPMLLIILFPLALVGYFIPFQYWFTKRFVKFKQDFLPKLKLLPINVKCSYEQQ
ncbi:MAG: hypothetical protein RBG13Loki_4371 [Promethearchaeota archaeon CR_4]|nr:MAG: hypothetical protein RBG13Loki_4371 [Candidatus Lokiarchaeota archaeon CR_4]